MSLDVVHYVSPSADGGWGPVTHAARLAARLFGADLMSDHPASVYSRAWRAGALVRRPRRDGVRLSILANPGHLASLRPPSVRARRYAVEAVWIFDAFWDEWLPRFARRPGGFDVLFVTDRELVPVYEKATGVPVHWVPWGTDTQDPAGLTENRLTDVLRVGRQPAGWDDDAASAKVFDRAGLTFEGRPAYGPDHVATRDALMAALSRARMTMAWSNAHSPARYTHPTREYISGRWTDAMSRGTQVLGIPPDCAAAELLPVEGLVIPESTSEADVVEAAAAAAQSWTTDVPRRIRAHAVAHLDWRHRFDTIRRVLGLHAPLLEAELARIARSPSGSDSRPGTGDSGPGPLGSR